MGDDEQVRTAEGKLYLCAVKDCYSNRIVGCSIDSRMKASLAVAALSMAIARRHPGPGMVVHSDRGSQFRSKAFTRLMRTHHLVGSMGRVSSAADTAAMESFFSLLQVNVLNRRRWDTRDQLRMAIVSWVERTYHRQRRQRALGKLTPIEFETIYPAAHWCWRSSCLFLSRDPFAWFSEGGAVAAICSSTTPNKISSYTTSVDSTSGRAMSVHSQVWLECRSPRRGCPTRIPITPPRCGHARRTTPLLRMGLSALSLARGSGLP